MFIETTTLDTTRAPEERNVERKYCAPPERGIPSNRDFYKYFVPLGRKLYERVFKCRWLSVAQLMTVLLCALALKYFYSTASVNELRWILAPTTRLVELISGQRFQFEPYAGYINSNHTLVIAASCAGVNFLLTAFLMLTLRKFWRSRRINWSFLPAAAVVAYIATIITNTVRITTAMQLREMHLENRWLSAGQLHRLEGIFVYFGFLLLLYVLSERFSNSGGAKTSALSDSDCRPSIPKRFLVPLLIYYTTTLGLPLANGAFRQTDFWEHSLFVIVVPLVFVIPFAAVVWARKSSLKRRRARNCSRREAPAFNSPDRQVGVTVPEEKNEARRAEIIMPVLRTS